MIDQVALDGEIQYGVFLEVVDDEKEEGGRLLTMMMILDDEKNMMPPKISDGPALLLSLLWFRLCKKSTQSSLTVEVVLEEVNNSITTSTNHTVMIFVVCVGNKLRSLRRLPRGRPEASISSGVRTAGQTADVIGHRTNSLSFVK